MDREGGRKVEVGAVKHHIKVRRSNRGWKARPAREGNIRPAPSPNLKEDSITRLKEQNCKTEHQSNFILTIVHGLLEKAFCIQVVNVYHHSYIAHHHFCLFNPLSGLYFCGSSAGARTPFSSNNLASDPSWCIVIRISHPPTNSFST